MDTDGRCFPNPAARLLHADVPLFPDKLIDVKRAERIAREAQADERAT